VNLQVLRSKVALSAQEHLNILRSSIENWGKVGRSHLCGLTVVEVVKSCDVLSWLSKSSRTKFACAENKFAIAYRSPNRADALRLRRQQLAIEKLSRDMFNPSRDVGPSSGPLVRKILEDENDRWDNKSNMPPRIPISSGSVSTSRKFRALLSVQNSQS
jgi:hypothetical protein